MTTALITGASCGIGLELARIFASNGHDLILVARRKELDKIGTDLSARHNIKVEAIHLDLSVPGAAKQLFSQLGRIDILVNNAGFGKYNEFSETDFETMTAMVNLNILALTELTRLVLPKMLKRKSGKILNIASVAGFLPGPYMAVYYASKSYVIRFTEALHAELKGTGVTVSVLCPGATETEFFEVAGTKDLFFNRRKMTAKAVAEIGYAGMMQKKMRIIPGFGNKLNVFLIKALPDSLILWFMARMSR